MMYIPYDIKKNIMQDYLHYYKCEICKKTFSVNKKTLCCKECYIFFVIKSNVIYFKRKLYIFFIPILFSIPTLFFIPPLECLSNICWNLGNLSSLLYIFLFSPIFFYMVFICGAFYFYFLYLFIKMQ